MLAENKGEQQVLGSSREFGSQEATALLFGNVCLSWSVWHPANLGIPNDGEIGYLGFGKMGNLCLLRHHGTSGGPL